MQFAKKKALNWGGMGFRGKYMGGGSSAPLPLKYTTTAYFPNIICALPMNGVNLLWNESTEHRHLYFGPNEKSTTTY